MEFQKLKEIIAEVLSVDPDEITEDTTFQDLAWVVWSERNK